MVRWGWMRRLLCACALVVLGCDPAESGADTDTDTDSDSSANGPGSGPTMSSTSPSGTQGSATGGGDFDQTLACESWLACLTASERSKLAPIYGAEGSCWNQTVAIVEGCDAECVFGFNEDCDGTPMPTTQGTQGSGNTTDTPPMPVECALDELAPKAESLIEAGDEEALLPPEIGTLLERVCSCHVAELEAFPEDVPLYYGNVLFFTHAQMHAQFEGAPTYVEVGIRALDEQNMPPVYFCGDAEFGSLHTDEYEILEAWIEAEAPDGADWPDLRPDDLPELD